MEEKSRFAQILIFWDAVLLGTLIFISLSVKPGLRCLWLHSAMLAECAIGLLILGILTFGKSEPDIVHGRLFTVMIGGISLQLRPCTGTVPKKEEKSRAAVPCIFRCTGSTDPCRG